MFAVLLLAPLGSGCVEAGLQSGVFACDMDSECPPGGFFCDNYFNTYMYFSDVTARPTVHGFWGFCNSDSEVIPKTTSPQKVYTETCNNKVDDDEDGDTDCNDTECQTAPVCQSQIRRECIEGSSVEIECNKRVGFPFVRSAADGDPCPLAVGYYSATPATDAYLMGTTFNGVCLPRCRLYFDYYRLNMENNNDDMFQGSDDYCTETVKNLGNAVPFQGAMKCVHLDLKDNQAKVPAQVDVCMPDPEVYPGNDCETDCSGQSCLKLKYRERMYLAYYQATGKLVPTNTTIPDNEINLNIEYCLTQISD